MSPAAPYAQHVTLRLDVRNLLGIRTWRLSGGGWPLEGR